MVILERAQPETSAFVHPGYQSILCPVDFSDYSASALRYAARVAERCGSRLIALYAIDPMLASAAAVALNDQSLVERTASELREFVRATVPLALAENVASFAEVGRGADEILRTAKRCQADLIVMGTHGLAGVSRVLTGSTTRGVLQRTTLPVLAVPPLEDMSGATANWPGHQIVAALDLNTRVAAVAMEAARVAELFKVKLVLAHVIENVHAPEWMQDALSAHDRIRVGHARAALAAVTRDVSAFYPQVEFRVLCGNPADEIAALVATEGFGLIVTMLDKRAGLFGSRRGSISYHVLTHATAPVLALPRP